jgi:hypothetical protein
MLLLPVTTSTVSQLSNNQPNKAPTVTSTDSAVLAITSTTLSEKSTDSDITNSSNYRIRPDIAIDVPAGPVSLPTISSVIHIEHL